MTQPFPVLLPHLNLAAVTDNLTFNFVLANSKRNRSLLALAELGQSGSTAEGR